MSQFLVVIMCLTLSGVSGFASEKSSFYDLKTSWSDQNGKAITLKDYSGTPVLISMVYTACAHTCPMTISKLQGIVKKLEEAGFKKTKIVLASFDPQHDTPENLKKFMKKRKLSADQWTFLSPKDDAVARELSVILGVSYKKVDESDFSHSNVITLLDDKGIPIARIDTLSAEIDVFVEAMKEKK